jgi:hypothetical protein
MGVYRMVGRVFTVERLVRCSDQRYFNTIPLHLWDQLMPACDRLIDHRLRRRMNETWSLATSCCILKEAARQIVENHWAMEMA